MASLWQITGLRSCVKVEVAVLGSLSLTVLTVSVELKQYWTERTVRVECSYGLCAHKATLKLVDYYTDGSVC